MRISDQEYLTNIISDPTYIAEGLAAMYIKECEKRRKELGLTYKDLAIRMGVTKQQVSKLMSGTQNSKLSSLVKLAIALDCQIELNLVAAPAC